MAKRRISYWQKRVQEQREKSYKRLNEETEEQLAELYKVEAMELQARIMDTLDKIERDKNTNEGIHANDLFRSQRYWTLLDEINERLKKLGREQIAITSPAIIQAYQETIELIDAEVPKSKHVNTALLNAHAIDAEQVVNQTWCLDGKKFSNRVWEDKRKLLIQLKKSLADSLVQGKSNWEIAKSMAERLDVSRENAYRLVRTETAHAQVYAQTQRYKEYGFTKGKYLASSTCCDKCKEHDGEIYTLDELESMLPLHPRCTCTYTLVGD